jgi:eukaryotic-like serine/threonine-protein kinase
VEEDGDCQQSENGPGPDSPELSPELMESIALEAVAATPISTVMILDEARSEPVTVTAGEVRPSFVIGPVNGRPIDEYCDSHRLDIPARLKLFSRVCEAVHFAHQHAMIHRDLKPSNILVGADGVPNVVDFGSAGRIDLDTHRERVRTPEYTSPEQINGEPVTTASDIYAMGVVLYQLLAGRWPYQIKTQATADVLQAACEQAPERPSVAVFRVDRPDDSSTTLESSPARFPTPEQIAAARSSLPGRLKRILAGDLDKIVLMALSKEPEGRYGSADQFAEDLDRYRKGLPVRAHRNLWTYRARKFARRYAAVIAAGVLLFVALVGGVVATSMDLTRARRDRERVEEAFRKSRQTISPIFNHVSEDRLLNQAGLQPVRQALLLDLKRFYEDVLHQAGDDPALRAEVAAAQAHLARIAGLTRPATEAVAPYQRAIALWEDLVKGQPDDREYQAKLAQTLDDFGEALLLLDGRLDEAFAAFSRARTLIEPLVAADPESASTRRELASILTHIAEIQRRRTQFDEAAQSLHKVVEIESQLAAEDTQSLEPRIALADAYSALGRLLLEQPDLVEARSAYQQAIEILDPLTREHPELADQSHQLASDLGDLSTIQQKTALGGAAVDSLRRSLEVYERLDQFYPDVLTYQEGLGSTYNMLSDLRGHQGETAEAIALARKARTLFERLAAENPKRAGLSHDLARSHYNVGRLLKQTGDAADALRSFQRAIDVLESQSDLDPKGNYSLARSAAQCVSLIGLKDQSKAAGSPITEPSKGDQLRRQIYSDRAIASLRRANRAGFLDTDSLQSNTDFDSIRHRPDFQALVKEVEDKPATGK